MPLGPYLQRAVRRENLDADEAERAMQAILEGRASTAQIAAFLVALRMKGETPVELLGFARAMRAMATRIEIGSPGEPLLDTCGTGGDGLHTFNISTVAAFIVAGAGVRVAKHGNRSASSRCGSADVLERLGVRVSLDAERAARAIREVGIGFLFAPAFHPAMKHAQPARRELRIRTVFNLLGPLTNPAGANAQLVGAPSEDAAELMAGALAELGVRRALVVHGEDGLDEVSTTAPTLVFDVRETEVRRYRVTPEDFGVCRAAMSDLAGGDPEANAAIARGLLAGAAGPKRDIALANAAAGLVAAGQAADWLEGMRLAEESLATGAALAKLEALAEFSNRST